MYTTKYNASVVIVGKCSSRRIGSYVGDDFLRYVLVLFFRKKVKKLPLSPETKR
jgi:hypothetical protein